MRAKKTWQLKEEHTVNKEEILKKAQKAKGHKDEREITIEREACEKAFLVILTVNVSLVIILWIQESLTGKQFANPNAFMFSFLLGSFGKSYTKYKYEKEASDRNFAILMGIGSLCCLANIIGKGMGWF